VSLPYYNKTLLYYNKIILHLRNDFVGLLATRFVRLAQKIVCSSHQIYMT